MFEFDIEKIDEYTAEELAEFHTKFTEALEERTSKERPSKADVTEAREALAALSAINGEIRGRDEAAAEMESLRAEAAASDEDDEDDETDEVEGQADEAEQDEQDEQDEDDTDEEVVVEDATPEIQEEREPVAAAVKTQKTAYRRALAGRQDRPSREQAPASKVTITASAEVHGYATGAELDLSDVGKAVATKAKSFPKFSYNPNATEQRFPVASFAMDMPKDLIADGKNDEEVVERAADERRLPGGSLVAAGWCAPSETIYDLCEVEGDGGMIDLPEFGVTRGGVRYAEGMDWSDLYGGSFIQTEAEAIADTEKTCIEVACPEFQDVRLDAVGLCLRTPILTEVGYPELVTNFTRRALLAHRHFISANLVSRMVAAAGAAIVPTVQGSSASNVLSSLELVAIQTRQQYRLPDNFSLEVVLPAWAKGAVRADIANRTGQVALDVTDAQIMAWFAARALRPQFIYGWQDLTIPVTNYPDTVQALVYPAGTFTKGTTSVINLSAVYDHASLVQNMYTGLFFEEGVLLLTRCYTPRLVTMNICDAGLSGAAELTCTVTP